MKLSKATNNYAYHDIGLEEEKKIFDQLRNGSLARGKVIKTFEKACKKYIKSKYAVSCSSGSAALEIALKTIDINGGDEVIIPNISWISTASIVCSLGAKPVLCDISNHSPNILLSEITKKITKKTKAIIVVHFAGISVDMEILKKKIKRKIFIIEDAAHAFGGKYKSKKMIGNTNISDFVCFSFHPAKNITTGEGGLITTNKKKHYDKLKILRSNGIIKEKNFISGFYKVKFFSSNYNMTSLSAAMGLAQLKKIKKFISKRKKLYESYSSNLNNNRNILIIKHPKYSAYNLFIILVKKKRNKLMKFLKKNKIGAHFHYPPFSEMKIFKNLKKGYFQFSNEYSKKALTLPLNTKMTVNDVKIISRIINNYKFIN